MCERTLRVLLLMCYVLCYRPSRVDKFQVQRFEEIFNANVCERNAMGKTLLIYCLLLGEFDNLTCQKMYSFDYLAS